MALTLDHINIRTNDVKAVSNTLVRLLKLKEGYRPPFSTDGIWLYGNDYPIVHLSKRDRAPGDDTGGLDHIAFKDDDYEGLKARLDEDGVEYTDREVPDTGVRQVFFKISHEIKIEVDFAPATVGNIE